MNISEIMDAARQANARPILNIIDPDNCCSRRFHEAARKGTLDAAETWTCPKCGVEYRPTLVDGVIRHWTAHVHCELIRLRG